MLYKFYLTLIVEVFATQDFLEQSDYCLISWTFNFRTATVFVASEALRPNSNSWRLSSWIIMLYKFYLTLIVEVFATQDFLEQSDYCLISWTFNFRTATVFVASEALRPNSNSWRLSSWIIMLYKFYLTLIVEVFATQDFLEQSDYCLINWTFNFRTATVFVASEALRPNSNS